MTPDSALAAAIARHRAAQAALDAGAEEILALDALAWAPCASDAEFLEKLRYLSTMDDGAGFEWLAIACDLHFNGASDRE